MGRGYSLNLECFLYSMFYLLQVDSQKVFCVKSKCIMEKKIEKGKDKATAPTQIMEKTRFVINLGHLILI